jgi:hypothetical protein
VKSVLGKIWERIFNPERTKRQCPIPNALGDICAKCTPHIDLEMRTGTALRSLTSKDVRLNSNFYFFWAQPSLRQLPTKNSFFSRKGQTIFFIFHHFRNVKWPYLCTFCLPFYVEWDGITFAFIPFHFCCVFKCNNIINSLIQLSKWDLKVLQTQNF